MYVMHSNCLEAQVDALQKVCPNCVSIKAHDGGYRPAAPEAGNIKIEQVVPDQPANKD